MAIRHFLRRLRPTLSQGAALVLMACASAPSLLAIPARPGLIQLSQPDGSTVEARMYGDEYHHFFTTPDGRPLLQNDDGTYSVSDTDPELYFRAMSDMALRSPRRQAAAQRMQKAPAKAPASDKGYGLFPGTAFPSTGQPKALVILVEFSDLKFTCPDPSDYFNRMINERGFSDYGGTGSALDFFSDNSQGRFEPQFDVFGPVTLPNEMSYYGENAANGNDRRAYMMVVEAARLLDNEIDFSEYDTDGDGVVDNVFIFFAGEAESSTGIKNQVWPHTFFLSYASGVDVVHDGVKLDRYACSNEWNVPRDMYGRPLPDDPGRPDGIGTFVHEFSHVMGLPDLYTVTYNSAFTPGPWSTLDYGPYNNNGCTPPNYSIFERYALGWLQPREITSAANVRLDEISRNQGAIIPTPKPTEFFLFENRQQTGWDTYIPGHGLLVWHIDYNDNVWISNTVNTTVNHQHVDIEEADGMSTEETRADDAFPGGLGRTEFNDNTIPSMLPWTGRSLGLPISEITERADGVVTFKVAGGRPDVKVPVANAATDITPGSFKASWSPSDEADCSYALSVYTRTGAGNRGMVFVPGYDRRNVGAATEYTVDGLRYDTEYYYTVSVIVSAGESEPSEEVAVRTLPPTFDYLAPAVLEAQDVSPFSFTAAWAPLADAEEYLLTVTTPTPDGTLHESYDFTDGITGLPSGWSTTTNSTYAISANCGKAVPSLRLTKAGQTLATAHLKEDISALSFWMRGIGIAEGDGVLIEGYITGGEWINIGTKAATKTAGGATYTIENMPEGIRAIRITANHTAGSLAIDDVDLSYGTAYSDKPIDGYAARKTGNVCTYKVEGLTPATQYSYYVAAYNGSLYSLPSETATVRTPEASGIAASSVSSAKVSVQGRRVTASGLSGKVIALYDIAGIKVASAPVRSGEAVLSAPASGTYIITVDDKTIGKTFIK